MGKPPPMNASRDGRPVDVNNKVPLEFNRVPAGKRIVAVDETFFLNVIDIVEFESDGCVLRVSQCCDVYFRNLSHWLTFSSRWQEGNIESKYIHNKKKIFRHFKRKEMASAASNADSIPLLAGSF